MAPIAPFAFAWPQPKTGRRAAQYRALGGLAGLFCVAGVDRGRKSAIPLRPAPHSRGGGDLTAAEPSLRSLNPEPLETGVGPLLRLPDRRSVRWRGLGRRRPSEQPRTGARSAGPGGGQRRCAARAPACRKASVLEKLLHRALSGPGAPRPARAGATPPSPYALRTSHRAAATTGGRLPRLPAQLRPRLVRSSQDAETLCLSAQATTALPRLLARGCARINAHSHVHRDGVACARHGS